MTRSDTDAVARAFATGSPVDLAGGELPAELLIELLTGPSALNGGGVPALRLTGAVVRGVLKLAGATVSALVEFTGCRFDRAIDLYAANLAGWRLADCALPELQAANVRVHSELGLLRCTVTGPVELPDARIDGPLRLPGTRLDASGSAALLGVRLGVRGVLDARHMRAEGELRLSGARVDGNIDLRGARLSQPDGNALDAAGVKVGGNLRCDQEFAATGRVVLADATVAGNAMFSGSTLHGTTQSADTAVLVLPRGHIEPSAALVADRITVQGNVLLDAGFTTVGSIRMTNARIGGYVRLSGARLGSPGGAGPDNGDRPVPVALAADGIEIGGDLEARPAMTAPSDKLGALQAYGQVRLVGGNVHGSASLSGARLRAPGHDVFVADRLRVGGTLFLRGVQVAGSVRLHQAHIGSSLDCTGARLDTPRRRQDGSVKSSLDARAATIGKDLFCSRGFRAAGGVRLSLAEVSKSVNFNGARLGGAGDGVAALRARGLTCQELRLGFAEPPRGDVLLTGVVAGSVHDDERLWAAQGVVDIEDFRYQSLTASPEADVATRLRWLRAVLPGYDPDPYDQLAASYRDGGHDNHADTVLLAKQRHRHAAQGPAQRVWGWLQEWTVGYGYRPGRAALWLALCWLLGSVWFSNHPLSRLDTGQHPSWQPVLYTADLLIPLVNLGQDGLWRTTGPSAWVAGALTAVGWLLLSTAATGVGRILTRR